MCESLRGLGIVGVHIRVRGSRKRIELSDRKDESIHCVRAPKESQCILLELPRRTVGLELENVIMVHCSAFETEARVREEGGLQAWRMTDPC